ncbi:unnamed protein product [Cylindrotheca closterium]|uniref:Uncharacterized protein n=1 Tax=Cylindrotheca closterium TaxID=2856 RepID=A0AAD2GBE2_9STRA|nr:unnamed protein product [Cylindrotheca closterium]
MSTKTPTNASTNKGPKKPTKSSRKRKKQNESGDEVATETEEVVKLYKSPRFNGYLTISLASIINYHSAEGSTDPIEVRLVPASDLQQAYAKTVSLVSAIITGVLVVIHIDRWFLRSFWIKFFGPSKRYFELGIILFLLLWWFLAVIIQTSFRGIAGDGKAQYNLYYSTWVCLLTTVGILERKMVDFDLPTIRSFVTSWPYRAPGWISIFFFSFFTMFWYVDLFANTFNQRDTLPDNLRLYWEDIPKSQYLWLLFISSFTLLPCAIFVFLEIVRESSEDVKGSLETIAEGFFLALLTCGWIPSVIIVTTPGGFASQLGNAYFWTWGTTICVLDTFLWFIHDSRGNVQRALMEKEKEYKQHQEKVLKESQQKHVEVVDPDITSASDEPLQSEFDDSSDEHVPKKTKGRIFFAESDAEDDDVERMPIEREDDGNGNIDSDSVEHERRLQEANRKAYFNSLDDILE